MHEFSTELLNKSIYSIIFILLAIALMPTEYAISMTFLITLSIFTTLAGKILNQPWIYLIGNICIFLFTMLLIAGILIYHWEWI